MSSPGIYLSQDPKQIQAATKILKHFRAFVRSECDLMVDPYSGWTRDILNKDQAQRKLTWLVNMAVNRKAGLPDPTHLTGVQVDDTRRQAKLIRCDDPEIPPRFNHFTPAQLRILRRLVGQKVYCAAAGKYCSQGWKAHRPGEFAC